MAIVGMMPGTKLQAEQRQIEKVLRFVFKVTMVSKVVPEHCITELPFCNPVW